MGERFCLVSLPSIVCAVYKYFYIYIIKFFAYQYVYIYMLSIAGQTAEPNWLNILKTKLLFFFLQNSKVFLKFHDPSNLRPIFPFFRPGSPHSRSNYPSFRQGPPLSVLPARPFIQDSLSPSYLPVLSSRILSLRPTYPSILLGSHSLRPTYPSILQGSHSLRPTYPSILLGSHSLRPTYPPFF